MSLFTDNNNSSTDATDHTNTSTATEGNTNNADQPYLVVGDRAYHSYEDVQKKITSADSHIKTLEQEAVELRQTLQEQRDMLSKSSTVDSIMERLNAAAPATQTPAIQNTDNTDIDSRVREVLGKLTAEQVQTKNLEAATAPFITAANNDTAAAAKALSKACDDVGITLKQAEDLAKASPTAFFKMLGINQDMNTNTNPNVDISSKPGINTGALLNTAVKAGSHRDLKDRYKATKNYREKAAIMAEIDLKVSQDSNFINTT